MLDRFMRWFASKLPPQTFVVNIEQVVVQSNDPDEFVESLVAAMRERFDPTRPGAN